MSNVSHRNPPTSLPPTDSVQDIIDEWVAYIQANAVQGPTGPAGPQGETGPAGAGLTGVLSITDYGATGDGVTDDRAAIQSCITAANAAGYSVFVPPTNNAYLVSQVPGQTYAFDLGGITDLTIFGAGIRSVLKVHTVSTGSDFRMFELQNGSARISFVDMCFDGNFPVGTAVGATTEQNHILQIGTDSAVGVSDTRVSRCHFKDVRGDGVRFLGKSTAKIERTLIDGCVFDGCHRAGISFQRNAKDVLIKHCFLRRSTDQEIDFEPTGTGDLQSITIDGCLIDHSYKASGIAVTWTGIGSANELYRSTFSNNVVINGFLYGLNIAQSDIVNNHFYLDADVVTGSEPVVNLFRQVQDLLFGGNTITRKSTASSGQGISINSNGGVSPRGVKIVNNTINQYHDALPIRLVDVDDALVDGNTVYYHGSTAGATNGISVTATIANVSGTIIRGNTVRGNKGSGSFTYGIAIGGGGFSMNQAVVCDNVADGNLTGDIRLNGTFTAPPVVTNNYTATLSGLAAYGPIVTSGNPGSVCEYVGSGAPTHSAAKGSVYYRTDGTAGTGGAPGTLRYINTNGATTWAALIDS